MSLTSAYLDFLSFLPSIFPDPIGLSRELEPEESGFIPLYIYELRIFVVITFSCLIC
jgi:hypothetical protein